MTHFPLWPCVVLYSLSCRLIKAWKARKKTLGNKENKIWKKESCAPKITTAVHKIITFLQMDSFGTPNYFCIHHLIHRNYHVVCIRYPGTCFNMISNMCAPEENLMCTRSWSYSQGMFNTQCTQEKNDHTVELRSSVDSRYLIASINLTEFLSVFC